jgi:hypothetical protein
MKCQPVGTWTMHFAGAHTCMPSTWAEKLKEGLTRSHGDREVKKAVFELRGSV